MFAAGKLFFKSFLFLLLLTAGVGLFFFKSQWENRILRQMIQRLEADSRAAEVVVTEPSVDASGKPVTTIKFIEYSSDGRALEPRYFTFHGNLIQFQSLVIRFDDIKIRSGDEFKGKSAYLFWKVFRLAGAQTEEYQINAAHEIPSGYRVSGRNNLFESALWSRFWDYALDEDQVQADDVKNAQVEAPGTRFLPGYLYTIRIEHDGGLRIDAAPLPGILTP